MSSLYITPLNLQNFVSALWVHYTLADIKEGNVIFVYTDYNSDDDEVNYIAVGTQKVSATVMEFDDSNDYHDYYYLDNQMVLSVTKYDSGPDAIDVGSTYEFSMDAYGSYMFADKISGATDTYGVIKAATAATAFDNYKIKLYTSDDATKTLYLSEENPYDIDWTETTTTVTAVLTPTAASGSLVQGLIGYSLDSNGNIDAVNNTATVNNDIKFKSSKLLGNYSIDSACVVFTYDTLADTGSYAVSSLGDIDAGTNVGTSASPAAFILNDDGDVAAMFIWSGFANASNDDVYGLINSRKTVANSDGDSVYKYSGFIDGSAFSYLTNNKSDYDTEWTIDNLSSGVYAITVDTDGTITAIATLAPHTSANASKYVNETDSPEVVSNLSSDNTVIKTVNGAYVYTVAENAIVYKYDQEDQEYTVSKLSAIDKGDIVTLFDTKGDDADGIATVVIFIAN